MSGNGRLDRFLAFSAHVTAFTVFDLYGTGQAESYLATADNVVGQDCMDELLTAYSSLAGGAARDGGLRRHLLGDERFGPIARNIIKLWYVGIWYELPRAWTERFGAHTENITMMVSAAAYTEGLLWPAIGANPSGAKAPGYASWSRSPDPVVNGGVKI